MSCAKFRSCCARADRERSKSSRRRWDARIRIPQLNVVMRLGSTEGIKAFVRNSDAMAIVSVISVVDELRSGVLRIIDLEDLPLRRDFAFVHVEAEPSALVRQFIEFARADR